MSRLGTCESRVGCLDKIEFLLLFPIPERAPKLLKYNTSPSWFVGKENKTPGVRSITVPHIPFITKAFGDKCRRTMSKDQQSKHHFYTSTTPKKIEALTYKVCAIGPIPVLFLIG